MLGELDLIESDWAALLWAVGSTGALFEYSVGRSWSSLRRGEYAMNEGTKRLLGFFFGAGIAALLAAVAMAFLTASFRFFPAFSERTTWLPWLTLIVSPILAFIGVGGMLWRRKRAIALGLLCSALVLGTHFAFHVAMHGRS